MGMSNESYVKREINKFISRHVSLRMFHKLLPLTIATEARKENVTISPRLSITVTALSSENS